jgi:FixJ family two-component response regulator
LEKFGYEAVRIETVEGRRQYEEQQRDLADKAAVLRERMIAVLDRVVAGRSG